MGAISKLGDGLFYFVEILFHIIAFEDCWCSPTNFISKVILSGRETPMALFIVGAPWNLYHKVSDDAAGNGNNGPKLTIKVRAASLFYLVEFRWSLHVEEIATS